MNHSPKLLAFVPALAALVFSFAAPQAARADFNYSLTDSSNNLITFTLPEDPTPSFSDTPYNFALTTEVTINGVTGSEVVQFYSSAADGGLSIESSLGCGGSCAAVGLIFDQTGAQLFSGSETDPTLLPESNVLLNYYSGLGQDESMTLNAVTAIPEPSSVILTSSILFAFGILGRKRIVHRVRQSGTVS